MDSPTFDLPDQPAFVFPPPPPKFQHRYWLHILLFLATLVTTTLVGWTDPNASWTSGLIQSVPLLLILTAHEFGHYIACRIHDVDATLPFYIPAPFFQLTGTFGAVIKIREGFPSKKALFDIGVAGPIAGFIALLPFLWYGVAHSTVIHADHSTGLWLGEPLLFKLVKYATIGPLRADQDVLIHPVGFAAWFGLLATSLNLLPFGQLDGGHISYAVFGRRARYVSMVTLAVTIGFTVWSLSWISMAIMMAAMAIFLGFSHPIVWDEHEPLDRRRTWIAFGALLIFVLSFMPMPIEVFWGN